MDNKRSKYQRLVLIVTGIVLFCLLRPGQSPAGPAIRGFYGTQLNLPTVASDQVPVLKEVIRGLTPADIVQTPAEKRLDIYQQEDKAIIDWHSFDIGSDALTKFHQQSDWVALNQIYSANPTQIYGTLEADGTIYLINTNGILFGPGSQINVHSLAASSLGIDQAEFLGGILHFSGNDSNGPVSNHGEINAGTEGWIFLIAPQVENAGTINASEGQIGLIAGNDAEITVMEAEERVFPFIYVQPGTNGYAVNYDGGSLIADEGLVGLYGKVVQQDGLIRSVTATKNQGRIELCASEKVSTGAESMTLSPITDDPTRVHKSYSAGGGEIRISGLDKTVVINNEIRNEIQATGSIVLQGEITAPSGTVDLLATERVYLEAGGVIDAGGEWVNSNAESLLVNFQLNSMELKNDYGQKDGILLGEYITIDPYLGTAIGDASDALNYEELNAKEMNTEGGAINISASEGDIILREGSLIDFSGGGTHYSAGTVTTTALLGSDGQVYDISEAPQYLEYAAIMETDHYIMGHDKGDDAGSLVLEARALVMDGGLDGSVTRGVYQTDPVLSETFYGSYAVLNTSGTREPRGGSLIIGENNPIALGATDADLLTEEVVIAADAPVLPEDFGAEDDLKDVQVEGAYPYVSEYSDEEGALYRTVLSADILNAAGLSDLVIRTNTKFTTGADAVISLYSGGFRIDESIDYATNQALEYLDTAASRFIVSARAIEHQGTIQATSGDVILQIMNTITSDDNVANPDSGMVQMEERAYLANGSELTVAGDMIDNSRVPLGNPFQFGHSEGGNLIISDLTRRGSEVIVRDGALLDVSGGYEITAQGEVAGNDAGSLTIEGAGIVLEGIPKGYSLVGCEGGEISLHALDVSVANVSPVLGSSFRYDSEIPDELKEMLIISPEYLESSGFTQITLLSQRDLTFEQGVHLGPSCTKLVAQTLSQSGDLIQVAPQYLNDTSVTVKAGVPLLPQASVDKVNDTHTLNIPSGSGIWVTPGGSIDLSGLIVNMGGTLEASAGDISIEVTGVNRALTVTSTGRMSVKGINVISGPPIIQGLPATYDSLSAGSFKLVAEEGEVIVESGAVVDVSGPSPVNEYYIDGFNLQQRTIADDAGELEIEYGTNLTLEGTLKAGSRISSATAGSLSITKYSELEAMTVTGQDLEEYVASGFGSLTLASLVGLSLEGPANASFESSLTLDAPYISAINDEQLSLSAASILLANSLSKYPDEEYSCLHLVEDSETLDMGNAILSISGQCVDITGGIAMSGFEEVTIAAAGDMRLSDEQYVSQGDMVMWEGQLRTAGDLILEAARIYPTTMTDFTITSDNGMIQIASSGIDVDGAILSAGGSLTIAAGEILHDGYLAAPMGSIRFLKDTASEDAAERVYFSENSVTSVAGESPVSYGSLEDGVWTIEDKPSSLTRRSEIQNVVLEEAPVGEILIKGDEILILEGALINASGGGSIFGYEFTAGIEGLQNPLQVTGRYVVVPGVELSGQEVYLEGGDGLPAGVYSLLPEEYAFMPGAYVIEDLGAMDTVGTTSEEGYAVCTGYGVETGTNNASSEVHGYSIRLAEEVLNEGYFNVSELVAGDGGNVTIQGVTTVIDGTVQASPLSTGDFSGGTFSVSGTQSAVVTSAASLPSGFDFDTEIPAGLLNTAFIRSGGLSDQGFEELEIGRLDLPGSTVVIEEGAELESPVISLYSSKAGADAILLEENSSIYGLGEGGTVNLIAPDGEVTIESGAIVRAENTVNLNAMELDLVGVIESPSLYVTSAMIGIVPSGYTEQTDGVFYITEDLEGINGLVNLGLTAGSEITLAGDLDMSIDQWLIMDAPVVRGIEYEGLMDSRITAGFIQLLNTGTGASGTISNDTGVIKLAADNIMIGHGDILLDGFNEIKLEGLNDLIFAGEGSLTTSGDLSAEAARLALTCYADSDISYEVADFLLQAGDESIGYRDITVKKSTGSAGEDVIPGGKLSMTGRSIEVSTLLQAPSAELYIEAMGANADGVGISLTGGAEILAASGSDAPGGQVELRSETGDVIIAQGALIDVSAGDQGDAGSIILYAPEGGVSLDGEIRGEAGDGTGGSFFMDTAGLSIRDGINLFSSLNTQLATGGFDEEVEIRVRNGNVTIAEEDTLTVRNFSLSADAGSIDLRGVIDASAEDAGGTVRLCANSLVRVEGTIDASGQGNGAPGGDVSLGASEGYVYLLSDSIVDVSGGPGGSKGTVYMRAPRYESGAIHEVLVIPSGTIRGASRITTEAVRIYEDTTITSSDINTWNADTQTFMKNYAPSIKDRIETSLSMVDCDAGALHLVPGIEVQSSGDLRLAAAWDTTSWRYGGEAGVLTLRAGEDLLLDNKITDHPTYLTMLNDQLTNAPDSWGINLVAGADLSGADRLVTVPGSGDLIIADGMIVYTENAPIRFASGGDTLIGAPPGFYMDKYMVNLVMEYNLATYSGNILGKVAGDLKILDGGAIQSATGDIDITIGQDLSLTLTQSAGSGIRTTGTASPDFSMGGLEWIYADAHDGGDINLHVGGSILVDTIPFYRDPTAQNQSTPHLLYWDNTYLSWDGEYQWSADYGTLMSPVTTAAAGIVTMAGGDIGVNAGGDIICQVGTFKSGDLSVYANGNVSGYFQVADGAGVISAMGSFESVSPDSYNNSLALFDARVEVSSQGDLDMGAIFNPTYVSTYAEHLGLTLTRRYLDYSLDSCVTLASATGDVSLSGVFWNEGTLSMTEREAYRVLPPNLEIEAGKDIFLGSESGGYFLLAPSPTGNLVMTAGGDIDGQYDVLGELYRSFLRLSDLDPAEVYRIENADVDLYADETDESSHASSGPIHEGDENPVTIVAGGDILDLGLISPKATLVFAGSDIRGLYYFGQNLDPTDASCILAGGNIVLNSVAGAGYSKTGLISGGPGLFLVQAGNSMDLGITQGLQIVGNTFYSALDEGDSYLAVVSGVPLTLESDGGEFDYVDAWQGGDILLTSWNETEYADSSLFFEELKELGIRYSEILASGDTSGAADIILQAEQEVIVPFLGEEIEAPEATTHQEQISLLPDAVHHLIDSDDLGKGDILMTDARISSMAESSSVYIITEGDIDVGLTSLPDPEDMESNSSDDKQSGIFTTKGGGINIFALGDVNVNESRVMTFRGGDIVVWSHYGDINAGRGSKTAINAGSPRKVPVRDEDGNIIRWEIEWDPPSVGSGIRTMTYDLSIDPGDAYLFAPKGVIDAGEAGIAARNLVIGATEVVNAQNISFSQGGLGVSTTSGGGTNLGALGGSGGLAEASKLTEDSAGLGSTKKKMAQDVARLAEAFVTQWLDVKVIEFEEDEE